MIVKTITNNGTFKIFDLPPFMILKYERIEINTLQGELPTESSYKKFCRDNNIKPIES